MKPPALATWLTSRFGVNQSIVRDLIERYERLQSPPWFGLATGFERHNTDVRARHSHPLAPGDCRNRSWSVHTVADHEPCPDSHDRRPGR